MNIIWTVFLGVIGAACGSFVGALTWRMKHNRDIDEQAAKKSTTKKTKQTTEIVKEKLSWVNGRSICEHCGHKLSALDLIPIASWIHLRGKCRYCHKKIGASAILLEIGTAAVFVISFIFWPFCLSTLSIILFVIWLLIVVVMTALLVYDARWRLLPNPLILTLIVLSAAFAVINYFFIQRLSVANFATTIIYGLVPITGIYGALWAVSRGKLIGLGDVKLGVAIGLLLNWQLGLFVLITANFLATIAVMPLLLRKSAKLNSQIPFGPFLIIATFFAVIFAPQILNFLRQTLFLI